jgi:hypothetical protein
MCFSSGPVLPELRGGWQSVSKIGILAEARSTETLFGGVDYRDVAEVDRLEKAG